MNLQDAQARIDTIREPLLACGVVRLSLFGSLVRGELGPDSDIDVLVAFRPEAKSYAAFLEVADLLEAALGRHVDLVSLEGLSPHVGPHILAEATDVLRAA